MALADILIIIVAVLSLAAALVARSIWLLVAGELADSWRWILPGFAVYSVSAVLRALKTVEFFNKILSRLSGIEELAEMAFLVLVLIGLIRQYKLFSSLSGKE
jgi:hypothetical protein